MSLTAERIGKSICLSIITSLFIGTSIGQAATVNIDLESLPDQAGESCGPVCSELPAQWVENGVVIQGSTPSDGLFEGGIVDPSGISAPFDGNTSDRVMLFCGGCGLEFTISQLNGQSFDLRSLDTVSIGEGLAWDVTGYYAGGGSISTVLYLDNTWSTEVFNGDWTNLQQVTIDVNTGDIASAFDNIVVTTIPVPATVWLLGSALAGLGWLRHKQTV